MTQPVNTNDLSRLRIDRKQIQPPAVRKQRVVIFGGLFTLCLLIAILLYHLQGGLETNELEQRKGDQAHPRWIETARALSQPLVLNATGYVVAQRSAAVSSKATGRLKELEIKEGDAVEKGQILGVLENDDIQAQVRQMEASVAAARSSEGAAQAELDEASLHLGRIRKLKVSNFSSQSDLDIALSRVRKAQSQVDTVKAQTALAEAQLAYAQTELEYTFIRAPFGGTVLKKNSEVGEIVAPFGSSTNARAAIATIADMSSLQVEADVSEANLSKVYVNQEADIVFDSLPEKVYRGMVDKIVPTVDRAKGTVLTKIRFVQLDEAVIPEMSAKVSFKLSEKPHAE